MTHTYIGVDISKDHLDVHHPAQGDFRIVNSAPAISHWLGGRKPGDFLVFEATSGCDGALRSASAAAGLPFARINPLHSWHFAQSLNLPKTDQVDARMLARFGVERRPAPSPDSDPARVVLSQLNQRRDQLMRMDTQEKNRLSGVDLALLVRDIKASLRALAVRISKIEAAIAAHLKAHPELAAQADLLRTIPSVGPVTAVVLLAHLPQLGQLDRRAIASLGGLAPRARDSGKFRGQRRLGPGRRQVRKALYMAALTALRHPHLFGGAAERMRVAGKPGKVVLIAFARKLLTIANAILRTGEPFRMPTKPAS